ncbi:MULTISPECIES: M20 aminoacylase family protein [Rhizobium/Agrobacterium group]|uniref:M20 aminoacylase family protein n=2 Tax=Neorhizobium TaxID=1525371 RepID=A0ABV0M326_9HYPH|nr:MULTISPECIES: M20 aminoacylase family protein [Rhizobium/Agrobacterium group]KGD99594.1 peptidase M20 [Rhizobium sp. YS-1r]MCC2609488.1 M20 family metallopeptidase [Neorhizobium petrolearium]WGI69696.1 M20 family metallopeptidase [Neorhizobium petrolearium]
MNITDCIKSLEPKLIEWRRQLHEHPETAFEEHRTAAFIAEKLRDAGLEVHEGIGRTGVVGVLRNGEGPSVALRADIDALDIAEATGLPYASKVPGKMHACGHDGHTAMLLGAARLMAANPPRGTVVFIFQPAEENHGGAMVMIEDGLFDRFPVDRIFGMHNWPGLPVGTFAIHPGPMMAAQDNFELKIIGKGAHAGMPHQGIDPILVAGQINTAWQAIVSRTLSPADAAVISITQIHAGDTWNIIPDTVLIRGTARSLTLEVRDRLEAEMAHRARLVAETFGARAELDYQRRYPATINTEAETDIARAAAQTVSKEGLVYQDMPASMGAEDFSFMLRKKPGAYIWIGNGSADCGRNLHSPGYDFNDEALTLGVQYWMQVAHRALALNSLAS